MTTPKNDKPVRSKIILPKLPSQQTQDSPSAEQEKQGRILFMAPTPDERIQIEEKPVTITTDSEDSLETQPRVTVELARFDELPPEDEVTEPNLPALESLDSSLSEVTEQNIVAATIASPTEVEVNEPEEIQTHTPDSMPTLVDTSLAELSAASTPALATQPLTADSMPTLVDVDLRQQLAARQASTEPAIELLETSVEVIDEPTDTVLPPLSGLELISEDVAEEHTEKISQAEQGEELDETPCITDEDFQLIAHAIPAPNQQLEATPQNDATPVEQSINTVEATEHTSAPQQLTIPDSPLPIAMVAADTDQQVPPAVLQQTHRVELKRMGLFAVAFFGLSMFPYATPLLEDLRPWVEGERIPLVGIIKQSNSVVANNDGTIESVMEHEAEEQSPEQSPNTVTENLAPVAPTTTPEPLEAQLTQRIRKVPPPDDRKPAKAEPLHIPGTAMDAYFRYLAKVETGKTKDIARAIIWGDSTIANDGIVKNVRKRMQDRFGDGGPGFLAVQVDPRWSVRRDILRKYSKGWRTNTIVYGGSRSGRYGLAGTVSMGYSGVRSTLGGLKKDGVRQPLHRFQIFYQKQPKGGEFSATLTDKSIDIPTAADAYGEGYHELVSENGSDSIKIRSKGNGAITMYGVAMETQGPGITWETFGVAGSSVRSMRKQPAEHIKNQVAARDPALVVYWTGGNELGYPSVKSKTGNSYKKIYRATVQKLIAGAPNASCLMIGPLDQAERKRGRVVSKWTVKKMVKFQREVATELGCAYWNAQGAMGGDGSFARWLSHRPSLASPDLAHLTRRGRALVGETLADVIMHAYDEWRSKNPEATYQSPIKGTKPTQQADRPSEHASYHGQSTSTAKHNGVAKLVR